jgi:hypothetical protein
MTTIEVLDRASTPDPDAPDCELCGGGLAHYPECGSTSLPCGWCDAPVPVVEDRGQVVYCSDACKRADVYVEGF